MQTKEILSFVKEGNFVDKICLDMFPFISKMKTKPSFKFHKEVTIRIETSELTKFGKPKPQRRRFDAVLLVKPFYSAFGEDLFSIGLEIKSSKSDLWNDNKLFDYIGYTNYFFLVVPDNLVEDALQKAITTKIGVINATNGKIVRMPVLQQVSVENSESILRQIAFGM